MTINTKKQFFLFAAIFFLNSADAEKQSAPSRESMLSQPLMTLQDISNQAVSNISISNRTGNPITVNGLFVASFDVNDCSMCFGSVVAGDNVSGTFVAPVYFKNNQTVSVGQNYLYNMLYNGIYYVKTTVGSSPCSLPGCSWPGDDPSVRWCLGLNAMSLNSNYTYSFFTNGANPPAAAPPYGAAGSSNAYHYNYDLINPNTLSVGSACLGPITCNDQTLTCVVNTAQNTSFQPY